MKFLSVIATLLTTTLAADLATCSSKPDSADCATFKLDDTTANKSLDTLCAGDNAITVGCSLRQYCKQDPTLSKEYCTPFSLLADICTVDKKKDPACKEFVGLCLPTTGKSGVQQCNNATVPSLLSTAAVAKGLSTICNHHPMPSCDINKCKDKGDDGNYKCDQMTQFRDICFEMDTMDECTGWNKMCKDTNMFKPLCSNLALSGASSSNTSATTNSTANKTGTGKVSGSTKLWVSGSSLVIASIFLVLL